MTRRWEEEREREEGRLSITCQGRSLSDQCEPNTQWGWDRKKLKSHSGHVTKSKRQNELGKAEFSLKGKLINLYLL